MKTLLRVSISLAASPATRTLNPSLYASSRARYAGHPIRGYRDLDEPRLPASAGVDLRLDDTHRRLQVLECLRGLVRFEHDLRRRHGHARVGENLAGLVFVDFHRAERYSPQPAVATCNS